MEAIKQHKHESLSLVTRVLKFLYTRMKDQVHDSNHKRMFYATNLYCLFVFLLSCLLATV